MKETNQIAEITKFKFNDNVFYAVCYLQDNKPQKIVMNNEYKEIEDSYDLRQAALKPLELEKEESKKIKSIFNNKINKEKAESLINQKIESNKSFKEDNVLLKMDNESRVKLLTEKGIIPGNIYKFETEYEGEKSVSYYEVYTSSKDKELRLKPYNQNESFKSETNLYQKANADNISGINALALLYEKYAVNMLNAKYQQRSENKEEFVTNDIKLKFTDITKKAREDEKLKKASLLSNKHLNNKASEIPQNVTVQNIPEDIKLFYKKKKNVDISKEEYTEKLFAMTKKFNSIDYNYQNISETDRKLIKPLLDKYKKTDGSEKELKKIFNQFIFDHQSDSVMERYGILFLKTRDEHFKGFEIRHKPLVQNELEDNLEAIKQNKHPLQQKNIIPDYIYNPETNAVYKGNNQFALQRNNLMNNINAQAYVPVNSFIQQNGNINGYKPKCMVIANGQNSSGQYVYTVCMPCKVKRNREEKKLAKEELRRNIFDAKFKYHTGTIPEFYTKLGIIPEKQPPVTNAALIQHPVSDDIQKKDVETQLNYDIANYIYCSLTKQEYSPCRDWTKEPAKTEFMNFAMNNPEKMIKMANNTYDNVIKQTKVNTNTNTNENQELKENQNTKKLGRK